MRKLISFNPQDFEGKIAEKFTDCPSIMSLVKNSWEKGYSEIHCSGKNGHRTLYVVEQKQTHLRCNNVDGVRYLLTEVSTVRGKKPDHWLVTCSFSRTGYLIPIGVEVPDEARAEKTILAHLAVAQ